jgi:hypothetical protein
MVGVGLAWLFDGDGCRDAGGSFDERTRACDYGRPSGAPPDGWRFVPMEGVKAAVLETGARWPWLRPAGGRLYDTNDFDGDGEIDEVAVLVREDWSGHALFVFRAANARRAERLTPVRSLGEVAHLDLARGEARRCSLGDVEGCRAEPRRAAPINLEYMERGEETYRWDGAGFVLSPAPR